VDPEVEIRPIREGNIHRQRRPSEDAKASEKAAGQQASDRRSPMMRMFRPTPYKGQIFDFIEEAEKTIKKGDRVLSHHADQEDGRGLI
jgi:hypothetical protein